MEEKSKMEELEKKELTKPISEEEFKEKVKEMAANNLRQMADDFWNNKPGEEILHLRDYSQVRKFKSIRRAIRRGHVTIFGELIPKRPFKNISSKKGNVTYNKKRLYEQFTHKNRTVA